MTYSILAYDAETGNFGGAAATGSLCVGGWVLRGDADCGLSASQGTAPSTLWGRDVLARMAGGLSAEEAVEAVTAPDTGRAHRQLAALDPAGTTAAFTGARSIGYCGHKARGPVVVSGNMLASEAVLDALLERFFTGGGPMGQRLIDALAAAEAAGSDSRGLQSAALLVVSRKAAPLTLRIDHASDPIAALQSLYTRANTAPYSDWCKVVPTLDDPHRSLPHTGPEEAAMKAAGNG